MQITFIGHAGMFIETRHGSILCDPWFNTAYFASWFPFPSNEEIDKSKIANPTYLFVSHLHHDHFDPEFLRDHVSKETTVLLPDYPLDLLERALRDLGFTKFLRTKNGVPVTVDGLRLMISAAVAPTDGPLGDSGLSVDDGEVSIFDQNDSRPVDLDMLANFGPYDAHFLQFSGAIWYPMVYLYPEKMMDALGRKKRENELARALRFVKEIGATHIIPSAGPPCFLDDDLFGFNDFDRDPKNIFPDQTVFLEYLRENGYEHGHLMIPGTVGMLTKEGFTIQHPLPDEQVRAIFTDKRGYLEAYQARKRDEIAAIKASWPRGQVDILSSLRDWFEPLMDKADLTAAGINSLMLLDCGETKIVLDFHTRKVYPWQGEEYDYFFRFDPALIESLIVRHVEDWINELFLSCRFQAERKGAYNEYVYNFFKCLSMERLQYAEGYYAEKAPVQTLWESHGYRIQRRCPHLKADLTRFAEIGDDGVLTCTLHGWQFELETGRCLTSDDRHLYTQKMDAESAGGAVAEARSEGAVTHAPLPQPESGASIRDRCYDCWYDPKKFKGRTQKAEATEGEKGE